MGKEKDLRSDLGNIVGFAISLISCQGSSFRRVCTLNWPPTKKGNLGEISMEAGRVHDKPESGSPVVTRE